MKPKATNCCYGSNDKKNHHVGGGGGKEKKKGIKQAVEFDEQWEWRKSLWLWELGSKSYSTKDREQKQRLKPSRKNRHPKRVSGLREQDYFKTNVLLTLCLEHREAEP